MWPLTDNLTEHNLIEMEPKAVILQQISSTNATKIVIIRISRQEKDKNTLDQSRDLQNGQAN